MHTVRWENQSLATVADLALMYPTRKLPRRACAVLHISL